MKNFIITLISLFLISVSNTLSAQDEMPTAGPEITFDKTTHNYGTIEQGGNGVCTFIFTNTGTEPLVLTNAKGSCSCTVPKYPKQPIAPGETAEITVKYNTNNIGNFKKTATIYSNASNLPIATLTIEGVVKAKPKSQIPIAAPSPIEN